MAYDFFGTSPVTLILRTTDNFNGTAQTANFTIASGVVKYDSQAGGGIMNMHHRPIKVIGASLEGGGDCDLKILYSLSTTEQSVAKLTTATPQSDKSFILPVGAELKIYSTGTAGVKQLALTAYEVWPFDAGL